VIRITEVWNTHAFCESAKTHLVDELYGAMRVRVSDDPATRGVRVRTDLCGPEELVLPPESQKSAKN
jgi:hypothetical protein